VYLPDGFSPTVHLLQSAMVPDINVSPTNDYPDYPEDAVSQWVVVFIEHLLTAGPPARLTLGYNRWVLY
jgi:hypothetical protein